MAIAERLSGWPGEELLWHGLYVKVLRRALISSLYCFIGGVCRLDRVGELNSEKDQLLHFVFLSFFCDFQNYTSNDQNAISASFASRFY